jgi:hypothetical protein
MPFISYSVAFVIAIGVRGLGLSRLEFWAVDQDNVFKLLAMPYALRANLIDTLEGIIASAHYHYLPNQTG